VFLNFGDDKWISYYIEGQGNYAINYNGEWRNKGSTTGTSPAENRAQMETFHIPGNDKTTITFSVVLPTGNSSAKNNYFEVSEEPLI
jgi:hypothetical protein